MIRNLRSVLAMMLMVGLLSACQAMTGETLGQNVDDTTLTTSVKTSLAKEKASSLTRVDVDTVQGVVSLNGVVATAEDKARAEQVARGVNGVKKVINNLQVQKK